MVRSALAGALTLAVAGCMGAAPSGSVAQPIVNGVTDDGDAAVVLWFAHQPGASDGFICTAEVISPHVLLTAAHCVDPQSVGDGAVFEVYPGSDWSDGAAASITVDEVHQDPSFDFGDIEQSAHDIAVGIVHAGVAIAPISYNHAALTQADVNRGVRIVGYGEKASTSFAGQPPTYGTKRQGGETIHVLDPLTLGLVGGFNETCHGDSGGPALLKVAGKEAIAGVDSLGDDPCSSMSGAIESRVDALTGFIDPFVDQWDPQADAGAIGADCSTNRDCQSLVCGNDGKRDYCSAACDPGGPDVCPAGYRCTSIDGDHFCAPATHGCDVGGPSSGAAPLMMVVLLLLLRRRVRG